MTNPIEDDRLLTRSEVAEILALKPQTLAVWAMTGKHLPVVRIGGRSIRYRSSDVRRLIHANGN